MDNLGSITRADAYPNSAANNPTADVMANFKSQVSSQSMPQTTQPPVSPPAQGTSQSNAPQNPQQTQTPQTNNADQFSATNSPSPLQDLQTVDMKTAQNLAGLQNGQLPDTIDIAHLNQYTTLTNLGKLGNQGDVTSGSVPKGFDPNQAYYGFLPKQCTSYAAWALNQEGIKFIDTGNGNAKNWPDLARKQGLSVTDKPQVGSVASWPSMGQYGHVAKVEAVNKDGTINVSEMNYQPGKFTVRNNVSISGAQFINK